MRRVSSQMVAVAAVLLAFLTWTANKVDDRFTRLEAKLDSVQSKVDQLVAAAGVGPIDKVARK